MRKNGNRNSRNKMVLQVIVSLRYQLAAMTTHGAAPSFTFSFVHSTNEDTSASSGLVIKE